MEKFFMLLIRYRFLVVALFFALAAFGYRAYKEIPIDAFPDITPKQVVIYTESPGNSAQDIEKLITYPIESAMAGLPGVKSILSNSLFGLSYVAIFFEDRHDIYFLRQLVAERLRNVDIPKGWGRPVIGPNTTGLGQVFWYVIEDKSKKFSLSELRELHDYTVVPLLKSVDGVEEVIGWGGFVKQYDVLIDPKRLQSLDITYDEIVSALQRSNRSVGGQYLEMNQEQYLIRGMGLYESVEDIKKSVVKAKEARAVTIEDVAEVVIAKAPRFGAVSLNGGEVMFGMVLQRSQTNAAKVVERIKEKIPLINSTLPEGVTLKTIYDRTQITHKAVNTMTSALLSGALLVAIILFLFLFEIRSAIVVIISLPLSLLIAFLLMDRFGISANLMSLSGLAIAIGMIVDATIVVVENCFRMLNEQNDATKSQIISKAVAEVVKPVFFAILVIVAIFIPLLSLDGLAGKLYSPMAINIVFVTIASLVVALFFIPVLTFFLLKPIKNSISPLMAAIKMIYVPILDFSLKNAKFVVSAAAVLFVLSVWFLSKQGREFMPKLNEESIMYRVIAIPGTSLSQSISSAKEIEKYILKKYGQNVDSVLSMIGRSEKGETAQANYMEILVVLKEGDFDIKRLSKVITDDLHDTFSYLQFIPTQPIAMRIEELLEGVKAELAIKIFGEDQKILNSLATKVSSIINNIRGIERVEVESQLGQAQIEIKPNYLALSRYALEVDEIMKVIKYGIGEEPVTEKIEGVKRFGIVPKLKDAKESIDSIKSLQLRSKSGKIVSLNEVCDIRVVQGPSFIKRENLSRYLVISIELKGRDTASFVKEADNAIKNSVQLPAGYYIKWAGDFKNMQEATNKLMIIIPVTFLIIFLILYTAFNSLSKAVLIMLGVPLGLIGGIAALVLSGEYLTISAIIGFITIFAIAILNGIVLVSFIEELRGKYPHVKMDTLLKDATLLRLRPVLMTAFTTLFGILPLLFVSGVGSEIQYPLAVVVVGGIISSTFLTLVALPALYLLFYKRQY